MNYSNVSNKAAVVHLHKIEKSLICYQFFIMKKAVTWETIDCKLDENSMKFVLNGQINM